ncbi:MAG TPA: hypothetical protein VHS31_06110 [Tepidisphaeraceae bacterium]|jgi:tetratricopeptide (TPR) repeat protein|nr:hypothetical protein [Tepidisphaeraceae bacterium]
MPRKPIVPVFAGADPAPTVSLYAGAGPKIKPDVTAPLPLQVKPLLGINMEWHLVTGLVLLLLILVAYGNSFQSEWVLDNKYIIELDMPKSASWADQAKSAGVRNIFMQDYWWPKGISGLYRPITTFTYWLNWRFFGNGDNPTPREQVVGFHWVNFGVHFLNAFLFYLLMIRLTRHFWVAFFASTVFATHPIATESVTNIIGRADMFAATAIIGGLLIHMSAVKAGSIARILWLTALLLVMACGVFSKESAGALFIVIILYDVIYRVTERVRQIDWREFVIAVTRAFTIAPMIFFGVCVYLLVLVPWMGQMNDVDTSYTYSNTTTLGDPGAAKIRFNNLTPAKATALYISNSGGDSRLTATALQGRGQTLAPISQKIKIYKSNDSSQWALFKASGPLGGAGSWSTLSLSYITGNGSFNESDPVVVSFIDSSFPWAIVGTVLGLFVLFFSSVLLTTRNIWPVVAAVGFSVVVLISMGLCYQPRPEEQPAGAGLAVIRLHLAPNPSAQPYVDAIAKAAAANQPNPVVVSLCRLSLNGLWIFALVFLGVEFAFKYLWPEETIDKEKRDLWRGFYDSYFVLWSVSVLLFAVRDWILARATPAEEPFLDNPLRGLSFIPARLTAAKVAVMLLWKMIWPSTLSSDYSYNQIPLFSYHGVTTWQNFECLLSALLFAGIIFLAFWCLKRGQKAIAFFLGLYLINYLPTSNLTLIIGSIMAERFMYLPLIAFAAILVIVIDLLARRFFFPLDDTETPVLQPAPGGGTSVPSSSRIYRYLPHILLSVLTVAYGIRAFARNYDWHTDVTLWTSAQKLSPMSFRSYQSLAFALFEQDAEGNIDRMIDIDEQGLKIVDDLPNPNNSSRLYLHLGMYYGAKGELLSRGKPNVPEDAKIWFVKSAKILERGIPIDRAFNEVNRGRDVKRGRNGNETPDVGLAPVYRYLGDSYMRLGLLDQAERSYRYMVHLEPTDPESYLKLANLNVQRGRLDDAAANLINVILLDNSGPTTQPAWAMLNSIFQQINTEQTPCIIILNGHAQLDTQRIAVRQAILQAYRDFVRYFIQARRGDLAQNARNNAVNMYGFSPALFDELFDPDYMQKFPVPVPADPVFYKPDPVRFALMMPEVQKAFTDATGNNDLKTIDEEITEGRAVYYTDQSIDGKMYRIRISEEGKLLSKEPLNGK